MIYPIPPGLFCVPSALAALTGADPISVIVPAINRHERLPDGGLMDTPTAVHVYAMVGVLKELRFQVRPYKSDAEGGQLRARVSTWAKRSVERWPGRNLLICTSDHALVISDGVVYDTHVPIGCSGEQHPFARAIVTWAALIEPPPA